TRIDTIYGATAVVLAPEHPLVAELAANNAELLARADDLIAQQRKAKEAGDLGAVDKQAVPTGHFAINPFNQEKIPIWVANYVVMDYGTGAIMSVPAHDERDFEFAKKYGLEIRIVVLPRREGEPPESGDKEAPLLPYIAEESLLINSGGFNGLSNLEAQE